MKKLALLLVIVAAIMITGCQPPAAVTPEQLDALKSEISALKTDVGTLKVAVDSLTAGYAAHIEKYHKGFTGGGVKPPTGGTKPPQIGR